MMDWFTYGGIGIAIGMFVAMGLAWVIWRRSPARAIVDRYYRARPRLKGVGFKYMATYQTTVSGGSLPANGDPRNQGVLDLAQWIARRHWDLIRLEFGGEIVWTREDGWIGDDPRHWSQHGEDNDRQG